MAATLKAILDLSAEDAPLCERIGRSLDALDTGLGFRRSALVLHVRGTAPVLVGHARNSSDELSFQRDMRNVQAVLSRNGETGVIRSALNQRSRIVLNDVTRDSRYVPGDEQTASEACLIETLSDTATLALNVECSVPGVFVDHEIPFLASVADYFAMLMAQNASRLFDPARSGGPVRPTRH